MAPMGILVAFLVGITWYSYVFLTPRASVLELIIFHLLLALLVGSYLQCTPLLYPASLPIRTAKTNEANSTSSALPSKAGVLSCAT